MINDRELIELAAKIAGDEIATGKWDGESLVIFTGEKAYTWNPLKNDTDALRLACTLSLGLTCDGRGIWAHTLPGVTPRLGASASEAKSDEDAMQKLRRCITRCAAEAGGMQ